MTTASLPVLGETLTRLHATVERVAPEGVGPEYDDEGRRIYWARAYSYGKVDRHGTTMEVGALAGTQPGVPILPSHNRDAFPLGVVVRWVEDAQGPWAGFVFADSEEGRKAEHLVQTGFLRAVSVGFLVNSEHDAYVRADGVVVFRKVELVELSLVSTPSSRDALVDLSRAVGEDEATLASLFQSAPVLSVTVPLEVEGRTVEVAVPLSLHLEGATVRVVADPVEVRAAVELALRQVEDAPVEDDVPAEVASEIVDPAVAPEAAAPVEDSPTEIVLAEDAAVSEEGATVAEEVDHSRKVREDRLARLRRMR